MKAASSARDVKQSSYKLSLLSVRGGCRAAVRLPLPLPLEVEADRRAGEFDEDVVLGIVKAQKILKITNGFLGPDL
jgi:hypothetical protein